jgi:hypothetical protein
MAAVCQSNAAKPASATTRGSSSGVSPPEPQNEPCNQLGLVFDGGGRIAPLVNHCRVYLQVLSVWTYPRQGVKNSAQTSSFGAKLEPKSNHNNFRLAGKVASQFFRMFQPSICAAFAAMVFAAALNTYGIRRLQHSGREAHRVLLFAAAAAAYSGRLPLPPAWPWVWQAVAYGVPRLVSPQTDFLEAAPRCWVACRFWEPG